MADTLIRLVPESADRPWAQDVNSMARLFRGINTGGIILRGDLGVRRSPEAQNTDITGRYTIEAQSKASGGLHQAWPLSGTSVTATPTLANSAALMTDTGLALGTTAGIRFDLEKLRIYESGRVDYSEATSLNGELLLGGSGAEAGALSTSTHRILSGASLGLFNSTNTAVGTLTANAAGDVVVGGTTSNLAANGNLSWFSGTANLMTLDHAATSARTITFQDLTGTVALLGVANAGGNLIFTDNTYDIGASGATRPRTIYVGTSLDIASVGSLTAANWYLGDTANANMSQGLTINQGANDNEILAAKSSDVSHGATNLTEADTYGLWRKASANNGGLLTQGFDDTGNTGLSFQSLSTTCDTTRATTAVGGTMVTASKISAGGGAANDANGNLFVVRDHGSARFLVDAEGDIHMDATSNINAWDDHDDVALLEAYRMTTAPGIEVNYRQRFSADVARHAAVLARSGVLTLNDDGHHFVSTKGLQGLLIDAIRQLAGRIEDVRSEVRALAAG